MGNNQFKSNNKINYEDIQNVIKNPDKYLVINTLHENQQDCLILNTINVNQEEVLINKMIKTGNKDIKIIIYGKNCNDEQIFKKHEQLALLGFYNIYIYSGGMFEWLLLQDIYGINEFPTTKKELDLLKYKPLQRINNHALLEY
jgi:hypothetical protein